MDEKTWFQDHLYYYLNTEVFPFLFLFEALSTQSIFPSHLYLVSLMTGLYPAQVSGRYRISHINEEVDIHSAHPPTTDSPYTTHLYDLL